MLSAFAVAQLIDDQHHASCTGPKDAHVLQFGLGLGVVMTMADQDSRSCLAGLFRPIQVRRHPQLGPALEEKRFNDITLALEFTCDLHRQRFGHGGKLPQGVF